MHPELDDLKLFFRLHQTLLYFVNQRLGVIPHAFHAPEEYGDLPPEQRLKLREAMLAHRDLFETFAEENPARLPDDELDIVRSWRHLITGKFYVLRDLKKYVVFLSTTNPAIAYGVLALSQPFDDLLGPHRPVMAETVLLPFKNMIVYDGLLHRFSISFGAGIRRRFNESYQEAKRRHGIVTALPLSAVARTPTVPKPKPAPKPASKVEKGDALAVIVGLLDPFCREHLNEEYAVLCRKLAETLARNRPSPLLKGRPNAWASGIVRAIGGVNFLHDKSQTPHMRSTDIDRHFGTSSSSGAAKLTAINKLLELYPLDPNWSLPSRIDDNPMVWILQINGMMMDVRRAPREVQEVAFKKGLIPYIPADRQNG